jgi:6-phosphogluconolactonase
MPMTPITRRELLGPVAAFAATGSRWRTGSASGPRFAYVGCFSGGNRHGEGISVYRVGAEPRPWSLVQVVRNGTSPSFLVRDPNRPVLYAVLEDAGRVASFRVDAGTGELAPLGEVATGGAAPTHLALDPSGRALVIANYSGGSVAVVPVAADGTLGDRTDLVALEGALGPHRTEQASGHPHQCRFDPSGRFLVVPDKGRDRVFLFRLDAAAGRLQAATPASVAARPGAGPRHIDFHPAAPYAYVVNELDSTVVTYRFDPARGTLSPVQVLPSIPPSFTGANTGAGIEVSRSGRFVYATNRGHDSVFVAAIDAGAGTLTAIGWTPAAGRVPRFFCLDPSGAVLYVANQASDTIVAFRVDRERGTLSTIGRVAEAGTPTSIAWSN